MIFYVGTSTDSGGKGIAVCTYNQGQLGLLGYVRDLDNPIYEIRSQDGQYLFAVGDLPGSGQGAAASYRICGETLQLLSVQKVEGLVPCHLALSADERFLYTANYDSGSVSVLPVVDGVLSAPIQVVTHSGSSVHPERQGHAYTHQCTLRPGSNELFVCDLGMDKLMIYDMNPQSGLLTYQSAIDTPCGMGPRHLVFQDAAHLYVVGELDNTVRQYAYTNGVWTLQATVSTLPNGYTGQNTAAALRLSGNTLYATNRGHDSLCQITLNGQGRPESRQWFQSCGEIPRDFQLLDGLFLFANQQSGGLVLTGGPSLPIDGALCICL